MKQVICSHITSRILSLGFVFLLSFQYSLIAQEGDPTKGKALFNTNCAACHHLDKKMTGPALRNVETRLSDDEGIDRAWLDDWIRNSPGMIKSGDAYANKIFKEYNGTAMTPMPQLSDQDITDILAYTAAEVPKKDPTTAVATATTTGSDNNTIILWALVILFALLASALLLVKHTLTKFAKEKGVDIPQKEPSTPLWKAFLQNQFLLVVTAIFVLLSSAYFMFAYFMQVGVDQGYEPVQPIHFSHKIHAGDNSIDCKYCHSSARVSKTSGIPSLNVCMNCHKTIFDYNGETSPEYSKAFYDAEIQKLYKAVGWDDTNQKYTGETQPVKWVRIHNLPDFVYFNHSQHVAVAGVECQTCHGPVETMEVVSQHAPLTMGWCIECHRETDVNIKENAYYAKIHEELSKKYDVEKLTVAQMGGLECGKCHY